MQIDLSFDIHTGLNTKSYMLWYRTPGFPDVVNRKLKQKNMVLPIDDFFNIPVNFTASSISGGVEEKVEVFTVIRNYHRLFLYELFFYYYVSKLFATIVI